jgi:prepilin-type N-terminal cleavage/methylation domain-containing protein/prepilin-type processing-associated H-X9-DG protein
MLYQLVGIRGRKKGFTLVELLVVISIIALLLSILMPALSKVRGQATKLVCTTRLKDLGTALGLYANDYRGAVPPSYWMNQAEIDSSYGDSATGSAGIDWSWQGRLASYYNKNRTPMDYKGESIYEFNVYRCPTQDYIAKLIKTLKSTGKTAVKTPLGTTFTLTNSAGGTFGINIFFAGYQAYNNGGGGYTSQDFNFRYLSAVKKTLATLPLFADLSAETKGKADIAGTLIQTSYPHASAFKYGWPAVGGYNSSTYGPAPNHAGSINYLFGDFHAESKAKVWPWSNHNEPTTARDNFFHPAKYPDSKIMP